MDPVRTVDRLDDPIVDEVRAVREAIDEEVGHDIAKLAERARRIGEAYRLAHGVAVVEVLPPATPDPRPCSRVVSRSPIPDPGQTMAEVRWFRFGDHGPRIFVAGATR
jgi:hypothetical protein